MKKPAAMRAADLHHAVAQVERANTKANRRLLSNRVAELRRTSKRTTLKQPRRRNR